MGKRHNRKRTRSRPRLRDTNVNNNMHLQLQHHTRSVSVSTTTSSLSTATSSLSTLSTPHPPFRPTTTFPPQAHYWPHTHLAYQTRQLQLLEQREREQEVAMQRLRIFGGTLGDETMLLEPMLKVVTDLFDGFTDYVDP